MKVKDLIKILQEANDDDVVVLSQDPEGNEYSELWAVGTNTVFVGGEECKYRKLTPTMREQGYGPEDVDENAPHSVTLWPG